MTENEYLVIYAVRNFQVFGKSLLTKSKVNGIITV